jgi:hypothetical protein
MFKLYIQIQRINKKDIMLFPLNLHLATGNISNTCNRYLHTGCASPYISKMQCDVFQTNVCTLILK